MGPPLANRSKNWPNKTKPGREEILKAGLTHPRPFSYLFYVASKPAGSNDHGISRLIRRGRLCVKPMLGLDRAQSPPPLAGEGLGGGLRSRRCANVEHLPPSGFAFA